MAKILIVHGPNLNMLGSRETGTYGSSSLEDINNTMQQLANEMGHELMTLQSNAESELIDEIQQARVQGISFIIINPAALTHSSIALRDALSAVAIPFIEVHLSNIFAREAFRHQSYLSDLAEGVIAGFGPMSYQLAMAAANHHLQQ